jgi:AcrR family transcriptional regulator
MSPGQAGPAPKPGRSYRGVSEETRRAERRSRLIETAIDAFGTRGVRHVSVRDICAESGFTPRYFYESFADLDRLLEAMVEELLQRMGDELKAALRASAGLPPAAVTRAAVRAYLEFLRKDARVTRILMVEIYGMGLDMDRLAQRFVRNLGAEFQPLLQQLRAQSLPRGASAGLVLTGILGALVFIGTRWIATGFGAPLETVVESCLSLLGPQHQGTQHQK